MWPISGQGFETGTLGIRSRRVTYSVAIFRRTLVTNLVSSAKIFSPPKYHLKLLTPLLTHKHIRSCSFYSSLHFILVTIATSNMQTSAVSSYYITSA
jgi:hypothetical protein